MGGGDDAILPLCFCSFLLRLERRRLLAKRFVVHLENEIHRARELLAPVPFQVQDRAVPSIPSSWVITSIAVSSEPSTFQPADLGNLGSGDQKLRFPFARKRFASIPDRKSTRNA